MNARLQRLLDLIARLWRRQTAIPEAALPPLPPRRQNRPPKATGWEQGEFTHYRFDHLLADLDDYFEVIRLMRRLDNQTYGFYRQTGAQLPPEKIRASDFELPATWRAKGQRMSMGMIHYPMRTQTEKDRQDKVVPASFVSFRMLKRAKYYLKLRADSDLFEVTVYYRDHERNQLVGGSYMVEVEANGVDLHLLKTPRTRLIELPPQKTGKFRRWGNVPVRKWDYGFLEDSLEDHLKRYPEDRDRWTGIEDFGISLFRVTVNFTQEGTDGLQVRVKKGGVTAKFNIGLLRTPYFFKDRQKTVTDSGKTKPIFHIVRAHRRILEGGVETYVKSHFRGVRRFKWLGYDVVVSMPGHHHAALEAMNITSYERDDPEAPDEKMVGPGEFGRLVDKVLDA